MTDKNCACSRARLALPAPVLPDRVWAMAVVQSRRNSESAKTHLSSLVQEVRALRFDTIAHPQHGHAESGPRFHVDHAGSAGSEPDRETADSFPWAPMCSRRSTVILSLTEESEYRRARRNMRARCRGTETQAGIGRVRAGDGCVPRTDEKYRHERVYPTLPDWPVVCFYNMSKRRGEQRNWYALPFEERRNSCSATRTVGRQYAGKVKQLITGSTGLDDAEWGVTLFARDTFQIKAIVYEMRFDPVSAEYADFGEFYIGHATAARRIVPTRLQL